MSFLKERPYYWLFAVLALVGVIGDLGSKYLVFAGLYPEELHEHSVSYPIIPGYFALETHWKFESDPGDGTLSFLRTISGDRLPQLNQGALFGIGNTGNGGWNSPFAIVSLLAALFILYWATRPSISGDRWLSLALGLILGGTLGNLFDRIVFGGVRDFFHVDLGFWPFHPWPDFNFADACLVVGASVLLVHSFFVTEPSTEPAPAGAAVATSSEPVAAPANAMEPQVSDHVMKK